jgi:hypothetical protein
LYRFFLLLFQCSVFCLLSCFAWLIALTSIRSHFSDEKRSSVARDKQTALLSTPQISPKLLPDLAHVLIKLGQLHRAAPRNITVMVRRGNEEGIENEWMN